MRSSASRSSGGCVSPYTSDEVRAADVRDDSMTGVQLFDGDIVLFVPEENKGDGIFVITVHGEVFVKRLAFHPFHRAGDDHLGERAVPAYGHQGGRGGRVQDRGEGAGMVLPASGSFRFLNIFAKVG